MEQALVVLRDAGRWLEKSGKHPSKWWQLQNLTPDFLLKYTKPEEFYVLLVDNHPACAAILQMSQNSQDWESVDKDHSVPAVYIHWLCVTRQYAGTGLPKKMIEFAAAKAKEHKISFLRVDTNADEIKLRKMYEALGFRLVAVEEEGYRKTAFYQKEV